MVTWLVWIGDPKGSVWVGVILGCQGYEPCFLSGLHLMSYNGGLRTRGGASRSQRKLSLAITGPPKAGGE